MADGPFDLDAISARDFTLVVAPLFEGAPGFLWRLAAARPLGSEERLFIRARELTHAMPQPLQVELIDAEMSFREQGYDLEAAENLAAEAARERDRIAAEVDRLNREYEGTFGFRYCVFVAGRPRSELLPEMAASLARERDSELHRALDAVVDIAADRYRSRA